MLSSCAVKCYLEESSLNHKLYLKSNVVKQCLDSY